MYNQIYCILITLLQLINKVATIYKSRYIEITCYTIISVLL